MHNAGSPAAVLARLAVLLGSGQAHESARDDRTGGDAAAADGDTTPSNDYRR